MNKIKSFVTSYSLPDCIKNPQKIMCTPNIILFYATEAFVEEKFILWNMYVVLHSCQNHKFGNFQAL